MPRKKRSATPQEEFVVHKQNIREAVKASGLTQEQIGVRMGYEQATARIYVCQILDMKNNPTLKTLIKLAMALNLQLHELLSFKKDKKS